MIRQLKAFTIICTLLFLFCTNVDFNNPIDSKGNNYKAENGKDDDGNGVPNIYEDDDHDGILNIDDPDSKEHIRDTIAPVFSVPGNDTVRIPFGEEAAFEKRVADFLASVKAHDNLDGDISSSIAINHSISSLIARVNTVTFTVADKDNNSASITRYVQTYVPAVEDTTPPTINWGHDTIYISVGDHYNDNDVTAWDAVDKDVPVSTENKVDTSKAGTYPITYTAKDNSGNEVSRTRLVIVLAGSDHDEIKPEITLKGQASMQVTTFEEFNEPGYTATDNHDGDITSKVVKDYGEFKSGASKGSFTLKYTVTDSAGNSTTVTRSVCLNCGTQDVTKPVLSIDRTDTVYTINLNGITRTVTAKDDVDGDLTKSIKRTGTFDSTKVGVYSLTYTVSDKSDNVADMHVTITVIDADKDTTKPVITIKGKNPDTVYVDSVETYVDSGATAKDSGKTITAPIVSGGPVDLKTIGSYTLTYTATDAAGNVATATRTVVVKEISNDLKVRYKVPASEPLASINKTFTSFKVEGSGPSFSTIKSMTIDWANGTYYTGLNSFSISTLSGTYIDLKSSVNTFKSAGSTVTIASTGIADLVGEYYVTMSGTNMVWVKKDGSYAIVWTPDKSTP